MKKTLFQKTYWLFLITFLISFGVALFFKIGFPDSIFELSITDVYFSTRTSHIWFLFAGYLFILTIIYYVISRTKLKAKKWMVVSHYIFIILFLVFFAVFSSLTNQRVQMLFGGIPLITLITLYGIVFLIDVVFFILGILFLLINIFSLGKNKTK